MSVIDFAINYLSNSDKSRLFKSRRQLQCGKKQLSWDNIVDALDLNHIIVKPLPPDQNSKTLWRGEKKKLLVSSHIFEISA